MARTPPSRVSGTRILAQLRLAGRKGDRAALALALDQMRTLAHSPKYWERYLALLRSPLARLVDLLVIKQGDRIAHQKGWRLPRPAPPGAARTAPRSRRRGGAAAAARGAGPPAGVAPAAARRPRRPRADDRQPSLFEG